MNAAVAKTEAQAFQAQFKRIESQIRAALPPHVSYEKFERVCMMAVQRDPQLLQTDQRSLFLECQKAAADGLVPDGREGVLVRRWNSKLGKEAATWQPMVFGLMKLARNSGEIASINAHVVYKGELFQVLLGDDEHIQHERNLDLVDDAPEIAVYAVATLKDGMKIREVLTAKQVEKIRNVNTKWEKGPWGGPFKSEMWKKSAIRRLSKRLPLSTDRDGDDRFQKAVERSDDADVFIEGTVAEPAATEAHTSRLDALEHQISDVEAETPAQEGEVIPPDPLSDFAADLLQQFQHAKTTHDLAQIIANAAVKSKLKKIETERPDLNTQVRAAYDQRAADFAPATGG